MVLVNCLGEALLGFARAVHKSKSSYPDGYSFTLIGWYVLCRPLIIFVVCSGGLYKKKAPTFCNPNAALIADVLLLQMELKITRNTRPLFQGDSPAELIPHRALLNKASSFFNLCPDIIVMHCICPSDKAEPR